MSGWCVLDAMTAVASLFQLVTSAAWLAPAGGGSGSAARSPCTRAPMARACICINCKFVDRCSTYHWVETQHEQPHVTRSPDFEPDNPQGAPRQAATIARTAPHACAARMRRALPDARDRPETPLCPPRLCVQSRYFFATKATRRRTWWVIQTKVPRAPTARSSGPSSRRSSTCLAATRLLRIQGSGCDSCQTWAMCRHSARAERTLQVAAADSDLH